MVKEVLIYGRGGQGNVTAAELLAIAAFSQGRYCQAFPYFGAERMGAPVQAYVRLDDAPIRVREQVQQPDYLIVQDESLLADGAILQSVKPGGVIIASSRKSRDQLDTPQHARFYAVPAVALALEMLGRPSVNVILLAVFAAVTGEVSLEALQEAARERFPGEVGEKNARAAAVVYQRFRKGGVRCA